MFDLSIVPEFMAAIEPITALIMGGMSLASALSAVGLAKALEDDPPGPAPLPEPQRLQMQPIPMAQVTPVSLPPSRGMANMSALQGAPTRQEPMKDIAGFTFTPYVNQQQYSPAPDYQRLEGLV